MHHPQATGLLHPETAVFEPPHPLGILQRLVHEVYCQGNLAAVDELVAPTLRINNELYSRAALKISIAQLHALVPGFQVKATVEAVLGEHILMHWTIQRGGCTAPGHQAASGRAQLFRLRHKQVTDMWFGWAALDYLQASGLLEASSSFA